MATETITIEVDAETARAFRALPEEARRKAKLLIEMQLLDLADPGQVLQLVMQRMGREAVANGMTPEILREIWGKDEFEGCF